MAPPSFESRTAAQASPWSGPGSLCNRSYLLAAMRAAVIAAVLLGILALIVLI